MIVDHDRSVPIVTRSATRSEHQLYEDKQEVSSVTTEEALWGDRTYCYEITVIFNSYSKQRSFGTA